ncbi:YiiG family protein [Myroides sp. M-43]|uniref:DUF3829 domain-containing protein n=1 Tax=Myroides oncorhynchi TaxID=2893756 RepID=UPI001E2B5696|nr:DUF3829 domain-containing protein [Myroides oncorhynchi]MCC9041135.1 YiiG family protein [Myroides oncorhynchi]
MKKVIILLSVCFFLAVGCKDNKEVGAENVSNIEQANQIITYTNNVIDYMNEVNSYLTRSERAMKASIEAAKKKKAPSYLPSGPLFFNAGNKIKIEELTTPPTVLSEEEQMFFKEKVGYFREQFNGLTKAISDFKAYMKNEDYKDDSWAKANEYAEIIEKNYQNCIDIRAEISEKLDLVTDRAEGIILEDSPIKEAIFTVKHDLKLVNKLTDAFYEQAEGENKVEELDKYYTELEANISKNKELYKELLEKEGKLSSYQSFYSSIEGNLGDYRKLLRNVKANKKVSDSDISNLNSKYNTLVGRYNSFI